MPVGLFCMVLKRVFGLFGGSRFLHFGQCLCQLLLGIINVPELVNEKFFQQRSIIPVVGAVPALRVRLFTWTMPFWYLFVL